MRRRDAVKILAGGLAATAAGGRPAATHAQNPSRSRLGIVIYALGHQWRAQRRNDPNVDLFEPNRFLDYCHQIGAGGVQLPLGVKDEGQCASIRGRAERLGMFVEAILSLPRDAADLPRFEAEVLTAVRAGAEASRVVLTPGRRYEQFDSLERYREALERGRASLRLAEPVAAKHRLRLGVENHKNHRVPEMIEILRQLSSPWIGACVDTGNNLALLEDPVAVVEALAPLAVTVHLKDHAVEECEEGFLLADVPLGQGFLDLRTMVDALRKAKPGIRFSLEMITRDPLKVPCLTEKYWAALGEVPGRDLARTIRLVRAKGAKATVRLSGQSPAEQAEREASAVATCLAYARDHLGL